MRGKHRQQNHLKNFLFVFYFPLVATPIMGVLSFFNWVNPRGLDWFYILALGVVTQVAQVFMTKGIQSDSAGNIMTYKYIGVVFAFIYGYFILILIIGLLSPAKKNQDDYIVIGRKLSIVPFSISLVATCLLYTSPSPRDS